MERKRRFDEMSMKEMKDAYVAKMEAQLGEWNAKLKEMKAKAEKAAAQGRIDYQQKLEQAKVQEKQERHVASWRRSGPPAKNAGRR
jgi:hypothetical protein